MQGFNHIIGHEQIINHLKSAIGLKKVSHAYIFTGEDGSGKNVLANAFAMALQCENVGKATHIMGNEELLIADETKHRADETQHIADETQHRADETQHIADETQHIADETQQLIDKIPSELEKTQMNADLGQVLESKNNNDGSQSEEVNACGFCKSCLQAVSGNHPDIKHVTHEKVSIGIDDIRLQVNNDIQIKPYSSPYKIYIIDEAEKLTEQAQNALLKTIEEPPAYAVIMLLTNNLNALLQTILSRCVVLKLNPVNKELIKEYLMREYKVPDYQAELSTVFAQGNVGKAIKYASSEEFAEMKKEVLHLLKYIDDMELYEVIDALKRVSEKKDQIYDYLDFMILWYRDVLMLKVTKDPNLLIYKSEYQDISKQSSIRSYEGIEKIVAAIEKAKVRLNANVNFDIAIELMLFTIKENGNG